MYQSFTGSSRRPRQVNLSGRNTNPFAATSSGPQQAILSAHQDRQHRQQQRQQLSAAKLIQRTWRGHSSRSKTKDAWRQQWDSVEREEDAGATETKPYPNATQSIARLRMLLLFFTPNHPSDVDRLLRYASRLQATLAVGPPAAAGSAASSEQVASRSAYLRMERACLQTLSALSQTSQVEKIDSILQMLPLIISHIPEESATISTQYYSVLTSLPSNNISNATFEALLAPLRTTCLGAYEGFLMSYLAHPHDPSLLQQLPAAIDIHIFTQATANVSSNSSLTSNKCLWLLCQYIYLVYLMHQAPATHTLPFDIMPHIPAIANLLAALVDNIAPESSALHLDNITYDRDVLSARHTSRVPLNDFLHTQLQRLVDQTAIRSLLLRPNAQASDAIDGASNATQMLAGYALALLRMFPLHADDIRMWLYLGPPGQSRSGSAMSYFWKGARNTNIFDAIFRDPRAAVDLLVASKPSSSSWLAPAAHQERTAQRAAEWRVLMIFLELYTFVLKIVDDEEFLGGERAGANHISNNALALTDIKDLSVFLKNLGFAMYYHAQDISDLFHPNAETLTSASLSRHFSSSTSTEDLQSNSKTPEQPSVAGITGMSLDYLKALVTGLLRAVYERDSRRQFLPKGHWLMTSPFDMSNFIQAVVGEEERRKQLESQEEEDSDDDDTSEAEADAWTSSQTPAARNRFSRQARDQERASKKRYLQAVAPRLEVLQNMPFLIPFETRVEIFREFVRLDQAKRRGGYVDSDTWRSFVMFRNPDGHAELNRHHAVVRRKHEFEDAFNAFYRLGADLKEPIQITFKDEFDIVEAGIDGGGVTKEFLTSVTSQAFDPSQGFFQENAQHLLYPNPTSVEEARNMLESRSRDPKTIQGGLSHLMQEYEFLGRVVGKCLYEGILIDIGFAGFFLTQWSVFKAGPSGQSAYRPTINDLRDLDEALYKGLLNLKYYPGNVEEDIPLTFTVTDEVRLSNGRTKTIESELMPGGANQAVTNENRLLYISLMARWRLFRQSYRQTTSFLKGLSSIIEPGWLSMFNQLELQTLIGGAASFIDVDDLRRNTQYGGVYVIGDDLQEHDTVKLFWQVMKTMSDEDRRKLLKFVTSTPRAPLLGFGSLNPRFSIRDSGDDESRFPTTSTCVNLLKLPRYKTAGVLREKLLYAVNSGAGFDLS